MMCLQLDLTFKGIRRGNDWPHFVHNPYAFTCN